MARTELAAAKAAAEAERRQLAQQRFKEAQAQRDAHRDEMADRYLSGYSKDVTDRVYGKAWDDGHAEGFQNVEFHYDVLADLIRRAVEGEN